MHLREAIDEKGRVQLNDVVLRLEPRDIPGIAAMLDHPKTNERAHLVHIMPDRLVHLRERVNVRIHRDDEKLVLAMRQPPKDTIKKRPPLRIRVARRHAWRSRQTFSAREPWNARAAPAPVRQPNRAAVWLAPISCQRIESGGVSASNAARGRPLPTRERRKKSDLPQHELIYNCPEKTLGSGAKSSNCRGACTAACHEAPPIRAGW